MAGSLRAFPGLSQGGGAELTFVEMPLMLTERLSLATMRRLNKEGRLKVSFSTWPCSGREKGCVRASYSGDEGAVSLDYDETDRLQRMSRGGRVVAEFEYGSFAIRIPPGW